MGISNWVKRLIAGDQDRVAADAPAVIAPASDPSAEGVAALEAGRYEAAAEAFRSALERSPDSAPHHVNLAYALQQAGAMPGAMRHLRKAVELDPASFDARYMLGGALETEGDLTEAIEHLQKAVALQPSFEPARIDLCRVLAANGDHAAARAAIEAAISLNPANADFHQYLGNVCMAEGAHEAALTSYRRAIELRPDSAEVHSNMGLALHALERFDEAVQAFEAALSVDPKLSEAHENLGLSLFAMRKHDEATASLRRALASEPKQGKKAETLNTLGNVETDRGHWDDAIVWYRQSIAMQPESPGAYGNLGFALFEKGQFDEAIEMYQRGLAIKPVRAIHQNLANALIVKGRPGEAINQYKLALAIDPDLPETMTNLAAAMFDTGDVTGAIGLLRKIIATAPTQLIAHNNLLFYLSFSRGCPAEEYFAEAKRYDANLIRELLEAPPTPSPLNGRRLRVGFVSGDLRRHPVGFFFEGVLQHLNPERFDLLAYTTSHARDSLTDRIQPKFQEWHVLKGRTREEAARLIRSHSVDILIDLAGHLADNGLTVFALRPAPVQISWLGYFASTGVAEMDYLLTDEISVPPAEERFFSERVWRLPDTRLCYTPLPDASTPLVAPLPMLRTGHVTFGCFQRFSKINDDVLALWGAVFRALTSARLFMQSSQCGSVERVEWMLARLKSVGISNDRVTMRAASDHMGYLKSHAEVDIVLDTFPYTGGTTTCEALWMGVPTLTLKGDSMLSRQGEAMMTCIGLSDWVAEDADDFVAKAAGFAQSPADLSTLRRTLRERARISPLFDTKLFARRFEEALLAIWDESVDRATQSVGIASSR